MATSVPTRRFAARSPAAVLLVLVLAVLPAAASAQSRTLTLAQAVALALRHNPALASADAGLEAARGREGVAMSRWLPSLSGTAAYTRQTGNFAPRPGLSLSNLGAGSPTYKSTNDSYDYFSLGLGLQQTVWDFGRTLGQHRQAIFATDAARADREGARVAVAAGVVERYYAVLAAVEMTGVAARAADQSRRWADRARALVEAGTRPRLDQVRAEADAQGALAARLAAEEALSVARESLLVAVGDPSLEDVAVEPPPDGPAEAAPDLAAAVKEALDRRPDRAALVSRIASQEAVVQAQSGNWWPTLGVNAQVSDAGLEVDNLVWNWGVGATLTVPILSAVGTSYQVVEAKAVLRSLVAQRDALDLSVRADVRQAGARVADAAARLVPLQAQVVASREAAALAQGRYETGSGNVVELLDAQAALANAEAQEVRGRFDLSVARTGLDRARGRMPSAVAQEESR